MSTVDHERHDLGVHSKGCGAYAVESALYCCETLTKTLIQALVISDFHMSESSTDFSIAQRVGQYVSQPTGYRAFIPAPLPPVPQITIEGELLSELTAAAAGLGRLDGSIGGIPDIDVFVYMYVRREAVLSSQIEGTQSSIQDVLAAEAQILDPERPKDVAEVINYVRAMRHGMQRLESLPVSVRLIREIHGELMQGVRGSHLHPGELRTSQNWIGGRSINEATFVPPPPSAVPDALSNLERFIHADDRMPVLIKIGIAHAQFETIHPFLDGNGRTGRLLIALLLCEKRELAQPVLYLSVFLKRYRQEYYDWLQAIRENGDWEGWLKFFLRGVAETSAEAFETVKRTQALREHHRTLIAENLGAATASGLRVVQRLYTQPIISVNEVVDLNGTSFPAANQLVGRLVDLGILTEITGQRRHRRFAYSSYIRLFDDPPATSQAQ